MRDYISLGSTPSDEDCIPLGADDFTQKSRKECNIFIRQLTRQFPIPQDLIGVVKYKIKSNPHDYGTYPDVVVEYEDLIEASLDFALKVEAESPESWDEIALQELIKSELDQ